MSLRNLVVAEELIREAATPDEAEDLLRRTTLAEKANQLLRLGEEMEGKWRRTRLRAWRRWGELLGPAEIGTNRFSSVRSSDATTGAEREARRQARKVAAVPEADFEVYVLTTSKPSPSALIHQFFPPKNGTRRKPPAKTTEAAPDETLIKACLQGIRRGKSQAEMGRKLHDKLDKHDSLPLTRAYAVAWDRHHHPRMGSWTGKTNTKRQRELEAMRNGDYAKLVDWQLRFSQMCALLETIDLAGYGLDTINMWKVADIYDDLVTLGEWHDRALSAVQRWLDDVSIREKIAKLRDTSGRTPEEADTALKLADRLESKLERNYLTGGTS